jgi:hypothetical protein
MVQIPQIGGTADDNSNKLRRKFRARLNKSRINSSERKSRFIRKHPKIQKVINSPIGRVISANKKAGKRRFTNSIKNSHPLSKLGRTAGRVALGGATAVAAGTLGAAIGIANGSPGDAIKYGLGAGASGYTLGRNVVNSIPTINDDKDAAKAYKEAYNVGPERKI